MAVYKATYCQPFSGAVDPNALLDQVGQTLTAPSLDLSCQIDTSNKSVTGYSITVWGSDNNQIFPSTDADSATAISPISEISGATGINGSPLSVPFFQAADQKKSVSFNAIYVSGTSDAPIWSDINGNAIVFSVAGKMFKWAITLYQGTVSSSQTAGYGWIRTAKSLTGLSVLYVDYSGLGEYWYDMKMASGTVLGSTNKRIQMARFSSEETVANIPDSTVVLQGRYMQLYSSSDTGAQLGMRGYVESYDSTYGHAYPIVDWSSKNSQDQIEKANYVSFYKYSNDPSAVLASEQVDYATTSDWVSQNGSTVVQAGGTVMVDGHQVAEGDWILIKDQQPAAAQLNGIWIAHISAPWERVGSYDTWAKLLGKVIYVANGDSNSQKNFQFQGAAGGTLLTNFDQLYTGTGSFSYIGNFGSSTTLDADLTAFNPNGVATGDTVLLLQSYDDDSKSLYYGEIACYKWMSSASSGTGYWATNGHVAIASAGGNALTYKITKGYCESASSTTPDASYAYVPVSFSFSSGTTVVPSIGSFAYSQYSRVYFIPEQPIVLFADALTATVDYLLPSVPTVSSTTDSSVNFDGYSASDLQNGQTILCAANGILYTASISNTAINWTPGADYSASLLTGSFSVNLGVSFGGRVWTTISVADSAVSASETNGPSMAQVLHNSAEYTYVSPYSGLLSGMRLEFSNPPSGILYPYLSIDSVDKTIWRIGHPSQPLLLNSAPINGGATDPTAPYKYDILSYFQQSDENPFYAYTTPTLAVTDVTEGDPSQPEKSAWTVANRSLSVIGEYAQIQRASWESYQFRLYDADSDALLQDTGKKYDSQIAVVFYGLSNKASYYFVLTVTDSLGNVISLTQNFTVSYDERTYDSIPFTATPDCVAQCVLLDYEDTGIVWPSVVLETDGTNYEYVYSSANSGADRLGWRYDDSVGYYPANAATPAGSYALMGTYSGTGSPLIDLATVPVHVWNYQGIVTSDATRQAVDPTYLSFPIRSGLKYSNYFSATATCVPYGEYELALEPQSGATAANEFSLQTQIILSPDSAGQILKVDIGALSGTVSSSGLSLSLTLPDNFVMSDGAWVLNPNRNLISVTLSNGADSLSSYLKKITSNENYEWFLISATSYYLQFKDADPTYAPTEALHYYSLGNTTKFYGRPYYEKTDVSAAVTPSYPIGNMGFIAIAEEQGNGCCEINPGNGIGSANTFAYSLFTDPTFAQWFNIVGIAEKGFNTVVSSGPYVYLFGDVDSSAVPSDYTLDIYGSGDYALASLAPCARHPAAAFANQKTTVTITASQLDVIEANFASLSVSGLAAGSDQTAGISFSSSSGSAYVNIGLKIG
jgi:hypothetical protein